MDASPTPIVEKLSVDPWRGGAHYAIAPDGSGTAIDSKSAIAYVNRGLIHAAKGETDGAVNDFSAAIAINPLRTFKFANKETKAIARLALSPTINNPFSEPLRSSRSSRLTIPATTSAFSL